MPERQPGFLVNDLFFVAGSSAMAGVRRTRPDLCPVRTQRAAPA